MGLALRNAEGRIVVSRGQVLWKVLILQIGLLFLHSESKIISRAIERREVQ